ncbi:ThiF family adenylyltransferase [Azospirillum canadense]|uniref:ThiF family adenylyltransferase n=1 Tax=Azospirillum canadense TaxID=403962 RepID=UPI002226E685|nr:ThiF family adenylyltransferase [Azospirillum canadense]MCW2236833.1 hypothetical protein [Azospirillum canadense]
MRTSLTMVAAQHEMLQRHLLPGDGREAVALALCGRCAAADTHRLLVHEIVLVPYEACIRTDRRVTWPTSFLRPLLERAMREHMAIVKIHSHPGGYAQFSDVDDDADAVLFPSIHGWTDDDLPHASAIMLPDGRIFGRAHHADGAMAELDGVTVIGDTLRRWRAGDAPLAEVPEFALRHAQAFGKGTFAALRDLRVAVVGCSGTGSVVIDQLARLGVGHLVLVDPERVEEKNLNRILNATTADVGRHKVDVQRDFVMRLPTRARVDAFAADLTDPAVLQAVAASDVVFGCMDSVDGRHLLNRLATFYLLPYIDVGVRLDADGQGGVTQVCGSVHYLQPGLSSLLTRKVYTEEQLRAAGMKRHTPGAYDAQVAEGYLRGVAEDRPAVNSVNMVFSAMAVLDLLARLHPYRDDPNAEYAVQTITLTGGFWLRKPEALPDTGLVRHIGRGDMAPMLGMPYLDTLAKEAA